MALRQFLQMGSYWFESNETAMLDLDKRETVLIIIAILVTLVAIGTCIYVVGWIKSLAFVSLSIFLTWITTKKKQ